MELPRKALQERVREDGVLDLSFQGLTEVPPWVWTLTNLRSLNLSHNEIADVKVPRDAKLPLLEDVDLSFNRLTRLPQQFQQLAELAPFRFLDVSSNDICDVRL
jgi:Leucine-rich repeat (LRR) protein